MRTELADELAAIAASATTKAAIAFIRHEGVDLHLIFDSPDRAHQFAHLCKDAALDEMSQALADAQLALEVGMSRVASATFVASFQMAGIKAGRAFVALL